MSTAAPAHFLEAPERLAVRRRNFFICAASFVCGIGFHPVLFGGVSPPLVAVQLAWAAAFVLLGVLVGSGRLGFDVAGVGSGTVSVVALATQVYLSGGIASPIFPTFYVIPLVIAVFTPGRRLPVLLSIAMTMAALVLMGVLSRAPSHLLLAHVFSFSFVALVSAYGSQTYRRLINAEQAAQAQLADSERRRAVAERNRAEIERLALVGQLASGVAHEVNNPLAFVKANLRYLQEELEALPEAPSRGELLSVLEETQQGVQRIQQIVTDLRQFSRQTVAEESCEVAAAVEEAQRLASVRLHSLGEVVREVSPELPRVRLGQRHLVQVLLNLLVNAADAVEAAVPKRPARIVLRAQPVQGGVRLEVEDNGPGIPPEVLARLFEPFFTTKPPGKGTGLGLALCREYVSRAGGTLVAENRPEGGARFILQLGAAVVSSPPGPTAAA